MENEVIEQSRTCQAKPMQYLRALVLLGGAVRAGRFDQAVGRSVLDFPIESGCTLMQHWQQQAAKLVRTTGKGGITMRVMLDRESPLPVMPSPVDDVEIVLERDPLEYRGTAGVLRDIGKEYGDEDYLLVANAGQLMMENIECLAREMAERIGDVVVVGYEDGTPSGVMMIRGAMLREIPEVGFADMKEQVLPEIAKRFRVEVLEKKTASGLPIRTPSDYITALRQYHRRKSGKAPAGAFEEDWHSTFSLVEEGAVVKNGAWLHDSVVFNGAQVEDGAVLVRSIACPGALVRRGRMHVDELIEPESRKDRKL